MEEKIEEMKHRNLGERERNIPWKWNKLLKETLWFVTVWGGLCMWLTFKGVWLLLFAYSPNPKLKLKPKLNSSSFSPIFFFSCLNFEEGVRKEKRNKMVLRRKEGQKMDGVGQLWTTIMAVYVTGHYGEQYSIRNGGKMGLYIDTYYGEEKWKG